jgi:hypothetical protein
MAISRSVLTVVVLAGVLCAFVGGYAVGQRATFAQLMPLLALETQFNLAQRVETLARYRTGDAAGAIAGLEEVVDTATLNLTQGKPWSDLEPDVQFSLQLAKAYRERFPPQEPNAALSALLATIPMPELEYCSPAMRELLSSDLTQTDRR